MTFLNVSITFRIFDSFSLKDKRRTIKSIIDRMHQRYNASLAEVAEQDVHSTGCIGISVVSSSAVIAQQMIDKMINEIEEKYEIDIYDIRYH